MPRFVSQKFGWTPRSATGGFILELPYVLAIIFFLLMFPLLNLVTSTARAYCLRQACMEAVHRACKAQSYINDIPADSYGPFSYSANHVAQNTINQWTSAGFLNGSTVTPFSTLTCIAEPLSSTSGTAIFYNSNPMSQGVPLASVNTSQYEYYLEIRTTVTAMPLVPMNVWFANVPGLTGAMQMPVSYRQVVEHPEGLRI